MQPGSGAGLESPSVATTRARIAATVATTPAIATLRSRLVAGAAACWCGASVPPEAWRSQVNARPNPRGSADRLGGTGGTVTARPISTWWRIAADDLWTPVPGERLLTPAALSQCQWAGPFGGERLGAAAPALDP